MLKLGIVGSGATGALTAYMLKRAMPEMKITILDKARGVGGRMCTSRSPGNEQCTVDLGAQYFTMIPNTDQTAVQFYDELLKANIFKPMNCVVEGMRPSVQNVNHFICRQGTGSLVKYFIGRSGCEVHLSNKVTEIEATANNKWLLKSDNYSEEEFDAVLFTIPVPQVLQVQGALSVFSGDQIQNMKKVVYNSRFAVGLFYDKKTPAINDLPWAVKYIDNNSAVRYISVENKKRGMASESSSLIVHTTKEFGRVNIDKDINEIEALLLKNLQDIIPNLPTPSHIKCHKWRYSQVEEPYPKKPGFITALAQPLLMCGGDGFSSSTFEGCVCSAINIVQEIVKQIQNLNKMC